MPARALGLSQVKKSILVDSARSVLGEGSVRPLTNFLSKVSERKTPLTLNEIISYCNLSAVG